MLDGMEELTLQVSYLIPFKSCFKGFPVMKSIMYLVLKLPYCVFLPYVILIFYSSLVNSVFRTLSNI